MSSVDTAVVRAGGSVDSNTPNKTHKEFVRRLDELRRELRKNAGQDDIDHLMKTEWWGRAALFLGYALAWILPNPVSIFLISLGRFSRWSMMGHHICHKGYDGIPGLPPRYHSKNFAVGWRRFIDWLDWLEPQAWKAEHNVAHHYNLGETSDPDLVEENLTWLRESKIPRLFRYGIVFVLACTWKFAYYAPNTLRTLGVAKGEIHESIGLNELRWWSPFSRFGRSLWMRSYLPYGLVQFCLVPLCFYPLGWQAVGFVLLNSVLAEICTNLHAFLMIVTNHAGSDLYRFSSRVSGKEDFTIRQIVGSANFKTGSDLNDFLHGFLNYQIEHHVWPNLSMRQYQKAQPIVQALCREYGIPYVQESVWKRLNRTVSIMVGTTSQKSWDNNAAQAPI